MEIQNHTNTILIALDGSPASKIAAETGVYFAKILQFAIRGLYVVDIDLVVEPLFMDSYIQSNRNNDEWSSQTSDEILHRQGEELLAWLEEICIFEGIPFSMDIKRGDVSELLLQEEADCELVTLGRRGLTHSGDKDELGRYFTIVAKQLKKPLLVSGDEQPKSLEHLLVAFNGSQRSKNALRWSAHLQQSLGAKIAVLAIEEHENDPVESWLEDAQELLQRERATTEVFIHRGQPADEIVAAATEHRSDLILMGHGGLGSISEWLIGSTVDSVLRQTPLPVLLA
jgi:nucleotide-binding universal stress UspA family protein